MSLPINVGKPPGKKDWRDPISPPIGEEYRFASGYDGLGNAEEYIARERLRFDKLLAEEQTIMLRTGFPRRIIKPVEYVFGADNVTTVGEPIIYDEDDEDL